MNQTLVRAGRLSPSEGTPLRIPTPVGSYRTEATPSKAEHASVSVSCRSTSETSRSSNPRTDRSREKIRVTWTPIPGTTRTIVPEPLAMSPDPEACRWVVRFLEARLPRPVSGRTPCPESRSVGQVEWARVERGDRASGF